MNRSIVILAASVFTLFCADAALASDKDDILAVLKQWTDTQTAAGSCADDASVIDDFPPFEWRGPGACANWAKAFDGVAQKNGFTNPSGTIGKPRHFAVEKDRAYVVAPGTFSYMKNGKPVKITAVAAFVLHKTAAGWKIAAWSWATTNVS